MNKTNSILLTGLILLWSSCFKKPANEVGLNSRGFGEEIALQQNLEFTFTHDLAPLELIGNWDSTEYFTLDPPVAGRFKWNAANELIFSPNHGFAPGTDYQLQLTKKILDRAETKGLYLGDDVKQSIAFHTPYLEVQGIQAFWIREEGTQQVKIKVQLDFNYEVEFEGMSEFLSYKLDDADASGLLLSKGKGKTAEVSIDPAGKGEEDVMLRVGIKQGLKIAGQNSASKRDQEMSTVLPSRLRLEITDVTALYEDNEGIITVNTSQALSNADLTGAYSLTPAVGTSVNRLDNGFEIRGSFDLSQVYSLVIYNKLEGVLGGKMKDNYTRNLSFGQLKPSISFLNQKAVYLSSAGSKNVGLNIVNVPKVKVQIYKIYQNNILSYLRHNSYTDWEYDYELDEYIGSNVIYQEDDEGHYSDLILEKEISTASLPKINGMRALNLEIPQENLDYRGIYFVVVRSADERYLRASKLVSISDVGIIAKTMENKILVMAHSIL
ncbi:MAG: alpha-2-macroglobulin family protein, partial [Bacteroidota bacterium]|nr:alpha-2-macroglobulin family protein [Bacteroidota bacterium]MDX5431624.1 alpha-2-macroglobulin family protein [Bacteroidota bacterium]MDX5470342.1 alpha-2-macroglobulin family protein [Bacteroidota bacterium]